MDRFWLKLLFGSTILAKYSVKWPNIRRFAEYSAKNEHSSEYECSGLKNGRMFVFVRKRKLPFRLATVTREYGQLCQSVSQSVKWSCRGYNLQPLGMYAAGRPGRDRLPPQGLHSVETAAAAAPVITFLGAQRGRRWRWKWIRWCRGPIKLQKEDRVEID